MAYYLLFDGIVLMILFLFVVFGAKRGLLLSLFGLLAVVVAFVGASFLAQTLAPRVGAVLEPRFAQMIEESLTAGMDSPPLEQPEITVPDTGAGETPAVSVPVAPDVAAPEVPPTQDATLPAIFDVLRGMGLYESAITAIDAAVQDGMTSVAANAAAAVAASVAKTIAYAVIFLIGFLLIMLLWTILSHALDLVAKLPGLSTLNKLGGAAFGLIKGCVMLFLCAWLLQYFGRIIPEETVQKTILLKFFVTTNPLALLLEAKTALHGQAAAVAATPGAHCLL